MGDIGVKAAEVGWRVGRRYVSCLGQEMVLFVKSTTPLRHRFTGQRSPGGHLVGSNCSSTTHNLSITASHCRRGSDEWCGNARPLGDDITACISLVSLCIEDPSPVWPLQDEATSGVIYLLAPSIVWLSRGLGSSHASIDSILAANKHSNVSEPVLER